MDTRILSACKASAQNLGLPRQARENLDEIFSVDPAGKFCLLAKQARKIWDYLDKHEKISMRFSRSTLRANFACLQSRRAKFGLNYEAQNQFVKFFEDITNC